MKDVFGREIKQGDYVVYTKICDSTISYYASVVHRTTEKRCEVDSWWKGTTLVQNVIKISKETYEEIKNK